MKIIQLGGNNYFWSGISAIGGGAVVAFFSFFTSRADRRNSRELADAERIQESKFAAYQAIEVHVRELNDVVRGHSEGEPVDFTLFPETSTSEGPAQILTSLVATPTVHRLVNALQVAYLRWSFANARLLWAIARDRTPNVEIASTTNQETVDSARETYDRLREEFFSAVLSLENQMRHELGSEKLPIGSAVIKMKTRESTI